MESKTNYTLVGLTVLILVTAMLTTALWLSVGFQQKKYDYYLVYLNESAAGLSKESIVKYNGVKVGYISNIQLNRYNPQQVILLLAIEQGIPITVSTFASLVTQGITGSTYVGLSAENADMTPLKAESGETFPVIPWKPSLFNQLDSILKNVSNNLDRVSKDVSKVLSENNIKNFSASLKNIGKITKTFADNSRKFDKIMTNLEGFSNSFPDIAKDMRLGLKKVNEMSSDVTRASSNVSAAMDAGKMAMKQISLQTIPSATIMLRRIDAIVANLEIISEQMRQNPSVIIRGTAAPKPGPGER